MVSSLLERLAVIEPPEGGALRLSRAWPRSASHVLLEYVDSAGHVVAGQWMPDDDLASLADETRRRCRGAGVAVVRAGGDSVLLLRDGADRRLRGLRRLLSRPGASLVSHRAERRAVVRLDAPPPTRFAKVVRRARLAQLREPLLHLESLPGRRFSIPAVVEADEDRGVLIFARVPGAPLLAESVRPRLVEAARAVGAALRWLHDAAAPPGAKVHDATCEIDVLEEQIARLGLFAPHAAVRARETAVGVMAALADEPSAHAMLHRDLHDKQILVDDDGSIGLLDFDTLATGEPALDVANFLAHLELRVMQQRCPIETVTTAATAFLEGYEPDGPVRRRVPPYLDAARLRLACVYAFRPQWSRLTGPLLDRVGTAPATALAPR